MNSSLCNSRESNLYGDGREHSLQVDESPNNFIVILIVLWVLAGPQLEVFHGQIAKYYTIKM